MKDIMKDIFIEMLKNSFYSVFLIVGVLLIRALISRKIPRWTICMLWALIGIRLLVPFSFETNFSLVPNLSVEYKSIGATDKTDIELNEDSENVYNAENVIGFENSAQNDSNTIQKEKSVLGIIQKVWFFGFGGMVLYGAFSFIRLKKRVSIFSLSENGARRSEYVSSPFVFGVFKPKIYIPYGISEKSESNIIAHEKAHIKRGDHITKLFAYVVLSIHWFNPFVWVYFITLNKDIEYACDEKVLSGMNLEEKQQYARALLEYSVKKYAFVSPSPVSFGEIGVKKRVKNLFENKITSKILYLFAITLFVSTSFVFMTKQENNLNVTIYRAENGIEVSISDVENGIEASISDVLEDYAENSIDTETSLPKTEETSESESKAKEFLENARKSQEEIDKANETEEKMKEKYQNSSNSSNGSSSSNITPGYSTAYTNPNRNLNPYNSSYYSNSPIYGNYYLNPDFYDKLYRYARHNPYR